MRLALTHPWGSDHNAILNITYKQTKTFKVAFKITRLPKNYTMHRNGSLQT